MSGMDTRERAVSPRRAAAAAWLSALAVVLWARFSLSRYEASWTVILIGVVAIVAFGVPLALKDSTRDLGAGLCIGAVGGLIVSAVVALLV